MKILVANLGSTSFKYRLFNIGIPLVVAVTRRQWHCSGAGGVGVERHDRAVGMAQGVLRAAP